MLMIKLFDFALGECLAESVVEDLLGARCPGARVDVRASVPERRCPSAGVRAPMSERRCPSAHCVGGYMGVFPFVEFDRVMGLWPSSDLVFARDFGRVVTSSLLGTLANAYFFKKSS
ncbi:unnamed protein product [Cochlearia groenlandica]